MESHTVSPLGTHLSFMCSNSHSAQEVVRLLELPMFCFGPWEDIWLELPLSPTMLNFCIQNIISKGNFNYQSHCGNLVLQRDPLSSGTVSTLHFLVILSLKGVYTAYLPNLSISNLFENSIGTKKFVNFSLYCLTRHLNVLGRCLLL